MKPEPINKHIVCSACGLEWERHKAKLKTSDQKPTLETCVELLKADLASRPPRQQVFYGTSQGSMATAWPSGQTIN